MQNSHDDGSTAALQILCIFLLMWEIMYHIARICIKKCLDRYPNIIVSSSDSSDSVKPNMNNKPQRRRSSSDDRLGAAHLIMFIITLLTFIITLLYCVAYKEMHTFVEDSVPNDGLYDATFKLLHDISKRIMFELQYDKRLPVALVCSFFIIMNYNTTSRGQSSVITSSTLNDAKQTLTKRGPSYFISFLHSIYVTYRGINHLYELWYASNLDKLYIPSIEQTDSYRYAHLHVATTNTLFLSYLMYDLVHIIHQYPKLGGVDTIVHHTLFALCSVINGTYGLMAFQFGWLIIGEVSTIFLNVRWFLLKSGRGGESVLLDKVNGLFAITFFISRIGVYTIGIIHLFWYTYDELISLPEVSGVLVSLLSMTCGSMLLGWALNILWGYKILAMVGKSSKTKSRKKKD